MRQWQVIPIGLLLLLGLTSPLFPRNVNFQSYLPGERAAGMAGAFIAFGNDASSSYYNPAGLGRIRNMGISLSANAYSYSQETVYHYFKSTSSALFPYDLNLDISTEKFDSFPSYVSYVLPLTPRGKINHVLAASLFIPDNENVDLRGSKGGDKNVLLQLSRKIRERSYWVGPSYALNVHNKFYFGISCFFVYHTAFAQTYQVTGLADDQGNLLASDSVTQEWDYYDVTFLVRFGFQYNITPEWSIGLMVQSQTVGHIFGTGQAFASEVITGQEVNADQMRSAQFEDKVIQFKLPWQIGIGAGYEKYKKWAIALDVNFYLPLAEYKLTEADVVTKQYSFTANVSLGSEVYIKGKVPIRFGFFTDLTNAKKIPAAPDTNFVMKDLFYPYVQRFGFTFSAGYETDRSTINVGLSYSFGFGDYYGYHVTEQRFYRTDFFGSTLVLFLGGSAKLFPDKEVSTSVMSSVK